MAERKDEEIDVDDADLDAEFNRMRDLLHERISEFAEEHDLPVGALSPLLLDLAVTSRMMDYALSVAKPSAAGLKLDLDRMRREVDDFIRDCKRGADEFIDRAKDVVEEMQEELEAEEGLEADEVETPRKG
jgi:hypothetical protein